MTLTEPETKRSHAPGYLMLAAALSLLTGIIVALYGRHVATSLNPFNAVFGMDDLDQVQLQHAHNLYITGGVFGVIALALFGAAMYIAVRSR